MENNVKVAWPGWEAVQLIGRGSFGSVYEIQRTVFNNTESSALKVISIPQNGSDIEEMYNDGYDSETITSTIQNHLQNIVSEYSMMKKMNDCVNIVNCEDLKYEAKEKGIGFDVYIKMELLTPLVKSLPEIITDDIVIKLAKDMCNALNVCKEYGVIHRDIKPQNIFVSKYGDYKLGDFGIAKTVEKTMGGTKIGTYKYMAPEVYNNQPYGSSADIYSLGLVLYWLLNERRMPFMPLPPEKPRVGMEEESRQRRFSGEPLPPPLNGSDELKRIVLKACAYNCADRYKDAREMLNDLLMLTNYYSNGSAGFAAAPVSSTGFAEYDEGTILSETINSFGEDVGLQYSVNPPVNVNNALGDDEGTALLSEDTSVLENVEMQYIAMPQIQENIPVMMTPPPSPVQPVVQSVASVSSEKKNSDKSKIIKIVAAVVVVLIGIVSVVVALKVGNKDNATKETDGKNTAQTNAEQQPSANGETTLPPDDVASKTQIEWSVWYDKLPDFVNADEYEIEEKIQYSMRNKEITSSTKTNSIDGWTLLKTVEAGGLGEWSSWSETPVSEASGREIESQQLYRYRNLENTTSASNNLPGWTLKNTTTVWSNYGDWSSWSTTPATASDSVKVESKTQYRKRDIIYYGEWSEWSEWSEPTPKMVITGYDQGGTVEKQVRNVSYYFHFQCSDCGKYSRESGAGVCDKANGGCGGNVPYSTGDEMYRETSSSQSFENIWKEYVDNNGITWFEGRLPDEMGFSSLGGMSGYEQIRTRTRERYSTPQYGEWTSWGDTAYSMSFTQFGTTSEIKPALEIETRTAYRYCTRSQITTYHFERWSDWSNWSTESISASSGKEVDTITQYRYRDEVKATTHYFYRWSEWGPYLDGEIQGSDTVEVRMKKQYRYKSKQN